MAKEAKEEREKDAMELEAEAQARVAKAIDDAEAARLKAGKDAEKANA